VSLSGLVEHIYDTRRRCGTVVGGVDQDILRQATTLWVSSQDDFLRLANGGGEVPSVAVGVAIPSRDLWKVARTDAIVHHRHAALWGVSATARCCCTATNGNCAEDSDASDQGCDFPYQASELLSVVIWFATVASSALKVVQSFPKVLKSELLLLLKAVSPSAATVCKSSESV